MGVAPLRGADVVAEAAHALGFRDPIDLMGAEGLAASVRRAASFACPTTAGALARQTRDVLRGLPGFDDEAPERIARVVEDIVAYGDLLELPVEGEDAQRRQLFLGPPAYVLREGSNRALLIGVRPEGAALLSEDLMRRVEYFGHARAIRGVEGAPIGELLEDEGLIALQSEHWLQTPRASTSEELLRFYTDRLEAVGSQGGEVELRVIDPTSSVTYYRGRWKTVAPSDSGYFVGRRPQAFGADLWCFARVAEGSVMKAIDLPVQSPLAPGADEAWRLQAALDASRKNPQRLRVSATEDVSRRVLQFFSPVPSWLQRRLDVVGVGSQPSTGALFAYEIAADEVEGEVNFAEAMLWMGVDEQGVGGQ